MDTYQAGRTATGHYATPGTRTAYCGRDLGCKNTGAALRLCTTCVKAEQRDRVAAEEVAADRSIDGPTLAERAGVRYARVGKGRRVHYSNNDDTLCGREVSSYTDGPDERAPELCAPCVRAAEERAYARALAATSPLAAAAVQLAETVEQADTEVRLDRAEEQAAAAFAATTHTVEAVEYAEGIEATVDTLDEAETLYRARATERLRDTLAGTPAAFEPDDAPIGELAEWERDLLAAAAPEAPQRFTTADENAAADDDVLDTEARHAAELVTEAEATAGTWRGQWIGDQPTDGLFVVEQPDQGALFSTAPAAEHRPA
ncbi:hypothetical protein ACGFYZ_12890 [Streptomyces sp. NPDC048330]|uniref:hypothetical protein n=1 Tax=Streptomyces sp. NPDC048330 TaxID=3365533 RepID=UPI00371AF9D0